MQRHHARIPFVLRCGLAGAALALSVATASAQNFYAGKTIDFIIGADVGGGYDIYSRTIGRHLTRFIPGNPNVLPKNMPGAGSAVAAATLYNISAKDGTAIGALMPGAVLDRVFDSKAAGNFVPSKFVYLASADSGTRVCITYNTSKVKNMTDARAHEAIFGSSAGGGSTRDYAAMIAKTAGTKFRIISGYKGTTDIMLAMERAEVDGLCGFDWNSLKSQKPDWLREKKINILAQIALEPNAELNQLNVPMLWTFVSNDADRKALELIVSQQVFLRSYIAPPGTPEAQVKTLRDAFNRTLADPEFLAEAAKAKIDINPSSGEKVQKVVETLYATPADVVARARELMTP
ncbi:MULTISPECIES: tripartite tricarboxylate transporter substrate-binding protein [unclassified Beijerinckia]|uniref:Bug family tripartite tricarboxylate transporter substrate binding protein n=1 Tax=unclassified Beijerinckia TaxID=2638183 RepID=UPI00089D55D4|nr:MULTISPECIES: tripartite tricarboxylate transporter substrate-binding protein [unclassified Beijerinckia]MDH7797175.1 tripartite-type tricarboxylate transporter receptor subunit TctC [Beijerinckia sp. GAS462]SEC75135.1 Tripartite-type tricarboxylate transporter, receptor component TctC [Beijerinckia sp. 28-YEA-48]